MEENGKLSVKDKVSFYVQINNFWLKNKKKLVINRRKLGLKVRTCKESQKYGVLSKKENIRQ